MILTHILLYCDGDRCSLGGEAENPEQTGPTATDVRRTAARSGWTRRKHPRTGKMADFCEECSRTLSN